jgi:hypothetical protein
MEYKLITLVDITATGQYRQESGRQQQFDQQQNFNTVLQTLGIRGNVYYTVKPVVIEATGKSQGFAVNKTVKMWQFEWQMEIDYLFEKNNDPIHWLRHDFDLVPIIPNLDETTVLKRPMFMTSGPDANIIFSYTDK